MEHRSQALAARASATPCACSADLQWAQRACESHADLRAGPGSVYNTDFGVHTITQGQANWAWVSILPPVRKP